MFFMRILIKASGRFTIRLKIGILILRVKENITGRTIAGPEFIFTVIKLFRKFSVKSKKKIPKSVFFVFFSLLIKNGFGRCIGSTAKETVQLEGSQPQRITTPKRYTP